MIHTADPPLLKFEHAEIQFDMILAFLENGEAADDVSRRNLAGSLFAEDILRRMPNRLNFGYHSAAGCRSMTNLKFSYGRKLKSQSKREGF